MKEFKQFQDYSSMLRDKIIEVATENLVRFGIKQCRMDAIASQLHISKKTIYDLLESKQNLLRECVGFLISSYKDQIERAQADTKSPLEAIVAINNISLRQALNCSPSFYSDIQSSVELSNIIEKEYIFSLKNSYYRQFIRAVEQGLLPENVNIADTIGFFKQQIGVMCKENSADAMRKMENYTFVILTHLSGICTDKGRAQLAAISASQTSK